MDARSKALRWLGAGVLLSVLLGAASCGSGDAPKFPAEDDASGPPVQLQNLGERIFLDTRFAEYFAQHMTGVNQPLTTGDPVVQQVNTLNGPLPGPFAGQAINCRSCHFVTEFQGVAGAGNRTYADFTSRSPIPRIIGGFDHTPRNTMQMVGTMQPHSGPTFFHFDGEFATAGDLVKGTLIGRNFGWAPNQYQQAVAHIALIIRQDDGSSDLAKERSGGLSYSQMFLGDSSVPSAYRIPAQYRLDVQNATDDQVVNAICNAVAAYMQGLLFKQDEFGRYIGSPYDAFLRKNRLPTQPQGGETVVQYNQRLYQIVLGLNNPVYVGPQDGSFQYHSQAFAFGPSELQGLKIFLKAAPGAVDGSQHAGNCAACHTAPDFTDFKFHNTGVSQEEYDNANGSGAFMALTIPTLSVRNQNYDAYLPATTQNPNASERFRHAAEVGHPEFADLGLWNVYLNPDMPSPQANIKSFVCANGKDCSVDQGLGSTVAQFKTPTLRDLEDSAPYFHNGSKDTFADVVNFYISMSQLARQGALRNPPPEFQGMSLSQSDADALTAFLKSLTEDYDDQ